MPVRLFVGNLSYEVTESDLREFFSPVGPLSTVIIPMDRDTGKPRGFAFVEFNDQAQADEANRRLNNQPLKGRNVTINEARARESRPGPGSGPGFGPRPAGGSFRPGFGARPSSGFGARPSTGFGARPSPGNTDIDANPMESARAGRAERRNRNFGADAKPARKKQRFGAKGEAGGKRGPIPERSGGQFFGGADDEDFEDDSDFKFRW